MLIELGCRQVIPVIRYGRAAGYFWTAEQFDMDTGSENIMLRVFAPRLVSHGCSLRGRRDDHITEWYSVEPFVTDGARIGLYTSTLDVRQYRTMAQDWLETSLAISAATRYDTRPVFELPNLRWQFDTGFRPPQVREVVTWAWLSAAIPYAAEHLCKQIRKLEEALC